MRAVVTGARGFIGRHVVQSLLRGGVDVVAIGRSRYAGGKGVQAIQADLLNNNDLGGLLAPLRADLLVHLAWYTEHGAFWSSPLNERWIDATSRLVDAFCSAGGKRVLGVGTFAEYEWSQECCREESTPLRPATPYGLAKNAARQAMVEIGNTFSAQCAWARIFIPIGTGESSRRLVPSVIDALRGQREPFAIDGDACRDFLHVTDVAEALSKIALSNATGALNVCAGMPTRIGDIVVHLAQRLGADAKPLQRLFAHRANEPRIIYGDASRLRRLGWKAALTTNDALDLILAELPRA